MKKKSEKKEAPPAAEPEKRLEDMTLAEQIAYQATRLKKKAAPEEKKPVAPAPEPDLPVIEETKGELEVIPENSRFMDSFRSDDDMRDQSVDTKRTTADQTAAIDPMNMDVIEEDPEQEDRVSTVFHAK